MNLKTLLDGPTLLAIVSLLGFALWLVWPRRRRRGRRPQASGPTGVGAALAFALEGDLARARVLLTQYVRAAGTAQPDAVLALVAVLRAQGDFNRAAAIVRGLRARQPAPWLDALCVRLCLDAGQPERAAGFVDDRTPPSLALAALVRAGRWREAFARVGRNAPLAEAAIQAGWAAALLTRGDERAGRKRLKRAHALAPDSAAVLAVMRRHGPRPADRDAADRALSARLGRNLDPADNIDPATREVLSTSAAQIEAGQIEAALGALRDALERTPGSAQLRRRYDALILEHGAPEDWRSALAERIEAPAKPPAPPPTIGCGTCGLRCAAAFYICPRCDHFDTVAIVDGAGAVGVEPSTRGAGLDALV